MGQLVFQATAGGQVALVGPNPTSNFSLNVPAVNATLATTAGNTFTAQQVDQVDASISGLTVGKGGGSVNTNTVVGALALASNSSGAYNNAFGGNDNVFGPALYANTTGSNNNAFGNGALSKNTTGGSNTAIGHEALVQNTTASNNTAVGYQAGYSVTTGAGGTNDAFGYQALYSTTTGGANCAFGYTTLQANTGNSNSGFGYQALYSNSSGGSNSAFGRQALFNNTTASNNTAVGYQAGYTNSTGGANVFIGYQAGYYSVATTSNAGNTIIGYQAGYSLTTGVANVFIGSNNAGSVSGSGAAITTGSKNTIIGSYNGNQGGLDIRTSSNYIVLSDGDGNPNLWLDNNKDIFVPKAYVSTTASAANMFVTSSGQFVRSTSALKYKQDIRDLESIDVNKFRPVRYKSKSEGDDQTLDHFGIIADEVDQAGIKELVSYGAEGEVEGFQYERLTVVLLKAVQELNTLVTTQAAEIAALKAKLGA